ncbi:hypothetical protein KQX54_012419 [Cotesia glomerata]|uniref:Uncharacterized protein n=1 Tax=Cotesia glomerata TaxID=32391 RepID=A0AAV7J0P0_COTGL|nr:hypothetical protein KQX54_012419 [Cotesia glomerata]
MKIDKGVEIAFTRMKVRKKREGEWQNREQRQEEGKERRGGKSSSIHEFGLKLQSGVILPKAQEPLEEDNSREQRGPRYQAHHTTRIDSEFERDREL